MITRPYLSELPDADSAEEWQETVTDVNVHEMAHSCVGLKFKVETK